MKVSEKVTELMKNVEHVSSINKDELLFQLRVIRSIATDMEIDYARLEERSTELSWIQNPDRMGQ